jgi:hypothetical protein
LADELLAAVKAGLGLVLSAAVFPAFALIETEKYMPLVIRFLCIAG